MSGRGCIHLRLVDLRTRNITKDKTDITVIKGSVFQEKRTIPHVHIPKQQRFKIQESKPTKKKKETQYSIIIFLKKHLLEKQEI